MSHNGIKVLVVEDEILIGLMLAKNLRSAGYTVGQVATMGEEAIERADIERPDVILMDVTLAGDINGIEAARQIRVRYGTPVIIFSGYSDSVFLEQAKKADPVAVLSKTGPFTDIIAAIEKAVG
ncbi:MAG: response regulator [Deltaproteobacteria bacterium]|nr:response regulator [Deltaproteobacteria bacterium]MBW2659174.1 response regulator [Deltaproteobacteria bacterium]